MNSAWKTTVSALLLVLTALIWGVAFVAQSVGSDSVGPFTFLCCRSMIAGTALVMAVKHIPFRIPAKAAVKLLVLGVVGMGCTDFLLNSA